MIISASRRTDVPTFYAEWMRNRIRAGFCTVPNPFNRKQISKVSLKSEDVEAIVFWTRNPRPLMRFLNELDERELNYYFQFTILGYPRSLDPKSPPLDSVVETFRRLSERVGPARVVWRYDPIIFSELTSSEYHQRQYEQIARALSGHTHRSVISIVDRYRKANRRINALAGSQAEFHESLPEYFDELMRYLADVARDNNMEIMSCAEEIDLKQYGILPGKCVDDQLIRRAFGKELRVCKDKNQRKACGCVQSRDIGMYDTCVYGCPYCYATQSFTTAKKNLRQHDPQSPSLVGWFEPPNDSPLFEALGDE